MFKPLRYLYIIFLISGIQLIKAQTALVKGIILDEKSRVVSGVNISYGSSGTTSDDSGFYSISIPSSKKVTLVFTHISYKNIEVTLQLSDGESYEFNPVMNPSLQQIGEVTVIRNRTKTVKGIQNIPPDIIRRMPGANAGVENILKSLPGVNSNNELSTQYSVRGGNYDENLVYVNEIEVYRPFLIRSGQQEGLSFINPYLVQNVDFSSGGFQAGYGDKLSSVLDITYRKPVSFGAQAELSLLGGSASLETVSPSAKLTTLTGLRYRDNSLLVNSKQTETNYNPIFADLQTLISWIPYNKFQLEFLGNLSVNEYDYQPMSRQTNFGSLLDPMALIVYYEGREKDLYKTTSGALKASYFASPDLTLKFIASAWHTIEREHFDILAFYGLGEVNSDLGGQDFGKVEYYEGVGSQLNHARNDLDALILNFQHKGNFQTGKNIIEWGIKYTHEDIRDRLREYEVIDSAGFSLRPPNSGIINNQPYEPFEGALLPYTNVNAINNVQTNRFSIYTQWSRRTNWRGHEIWMNAGLRAQQWWVTAEQFKNAANFILSPRAQLAIKPDWKQDMLFRLKGGIYQQPPFYRELRDSVGVVNPEVDAQRSWHLVAGHEYSLNIWKRPFKLISEIYYKELTNVNPYTLENVRIRYQAANNAEAYAFGYDMRLNGELVPGTESWISIGYLRTEENIKNKGYISRPTDQRLKFALLFQDYVPEIPSLKMYLNLTYNTGVPGGSPSYADPYVYQSRLRSYKRADVGINYVFSDENRKLKKDARKHHLKELTAGLEIFNIFDVRNAITNTWVRDVYTKRQYGIPNYMTGRVFNLKVGIQF